MITWLRYVVHSSVEAYKAKGWKVRNDMADTHHGKYAVLMIWEGEGEPN